MKTFRFRSCAMAHLLLAIAMPAFGGRMIDSGSLPVLPGLREAESAPLVEPALIDDDDDEQAADSAMELEPAEGAELPIEDKLTTTAPLPRWKLRQAFRFGMSHDDNIFLSSRLKEADEIFEIGANFDLTFGDYVERKENFLSIQYAPSYLFYAGHSDLNGFQQDGALAGQWRIAKLTLGVEAHVRTLIGGDVDVGARADRTLYQIALTAKYEYSEKTSLTTSFAQNTAKYQAYLGSVDWVNEDWIDYQISPKTRLGAGLVLGYLEPEGGAGQTYQQALLRISNPATGKLTLTASGGVEFRQFGDTGGSQTSPVFTLGARYQPFDGTEISLEASRRNFSSAAQAGQNYTTTGISASVRQRFLTRIFATLAGGYEDAKYEETDTLSSTARHDQYVFVRPAVSFSCTKKMNIELYYQFRRNTSTTATSSFDSNVAGMQATIGF